ncbi:MAG: YihA family ribosome biogenesis GTP-binding protein [Thiobacillaceae bacterium]|jgi:GTP-binding protein|nr:YihA family ribosome biogenesis GTP-binding protein [Hydrogenophilales bacterium]MBP8901896.1 YihA family ribosome biogenesis GTP-binding protein [Thiobacillaceae bacterium]MBP9915239.1 YihA family ribosome biogenesis GTP-binding protein [Thiobacillaceae bacterium]
MLNATFHITVAQIRDLPVDSLAEVAFAGRSNAGKSSAINTLCNHKRLAFVSKMPGRTQHLNFFRVEDGRFLVDLPGYGFARAPKDQKHVWQALIGGYLAKRPQLAGLVLIMDSRHPLTELDRSLLEWFRPSGKPVHVLLSKSDKLSRGPAQQTLRQVRAELAEMGMNATVQLFSSLKRDGADEAEGVLRAWLGVSRNPPKKNPAQGEGAGQISP